MGALKIVTRRNVIQRLKKLGDIIFLQETHLSQGEHEKLGRLAGTQIFSSSYKSAKRGVAVLLKNNLRFIKDRCIREKQGRFVFLQGEIDGQLVTLINVYDPPGERVALMKRILCLLMSEAKGLTIMGGDLNLEMNQKIDTTSRIKHKSEPSAKLLREDLSKTHSLVTMYIKLLMLLITLEKQNNK
uniref:Endonuclease/exonuclease/phosphatase domain-containing protein n=1 Tax=Cyprinus carpio TaxID=7962 RepID=A0A8C1NZZ5_CYPCA